MFGKENTLNCSQGGQYDDCNLRLQVREEGFAIPDCKERRSDRVGQRRLLLELRPRQNAGEPQVTRRLCPTLKVTGHICNLE